MHDQILPLNAFSPREVNSEHFDAHTVAEFEVQFWLTEFDLFIVVLVFSLHLLDYDYAICLRVEHVGHLRFLFDCAPLLVESGDLTGLEDVKPDESHKDRHEEAFCSLLKLHLVIQVISVVQLYPPNHNKDRCVDEHSVVHIRRK